MKQDRNGKNKTVSNALLIYCPFSKKIAKENKKGKKNLITQTPQCQCSTSPHLPLLSFLLLPCLVLLLAYPRLAFEEEGRGRGCRQLELSASLPWPALGLAGAAEEWGQP